MHKILAVIRREFIERVRTKAFIIGTILGPLFFGAMAIVPSLLLRRQSTEQRIVVVDGGAGDFGGRLEAALSQVRLGTGASAREVYHPVRVLAGGRVQEVVDSLIPSTGLPKGRAGESFDGLLIIDEGSLVTGKLRYYGKNVGSLEDMQELERSLTPLVISERLRQVGVDPAVTLRAARPVDLDTRKVTDGKLSAETGASTFILAYAMALILMMALMIYGAQVMTSIVEEKTNRIVEVLVSSLTPFQMMLGKVVGVGLVSLAQLGIWASAAYVLSKNQARIMALFGAASSSGTVASLLPSMSPQLLVVFLVFFVIGFLLYSSAFAAVGSMCNTVQETQQLQMPITLFTVAGWFSAFALLRDPTSSFARVASLIPPLAPFVVPVRYSIAPVPVPELLLSVLLTILGLLAIVWVAARIYRVGILMYGKRPSLRDMVRWVRAG